MTKLEEILAKYGDLSISDHPKEDMIAIIREACEEQKKLCAENISLTRYYPDGDFDALYSLPYFESSSAKLELNKKKFFNCPNIADQ